MWKPLLNQTAFEAPSLYHIIRKPLLNQNSRHIYKLLINVIVIIWLQRNITFCWWCQITCRLEILSLNFEASYLPLLLVLERCFKLENAQNYVKIIFICLYISWNYEPCKKTQKLHARRKNLFTVTVVTSGEITATFSENRSAYGPIALNLFTGDCHLFTGDCHLFTWD